MSHGAIGRLLSREPDHIKQLAYRVACGVCLPPAAVIARERRRFRGRRSPSRNSRVSFLGPQQKGSGNTVEIQLKKSRARGPLSADWSRTEP